MTRLDRIRGEVTKYGNTSTGYISLREEDVVWLLEMVSLLADALKESDQPGMALQAECDAWAVKRDAALARLEELE